MKRILLSLLTIGLVGSLATGATRAAFSDTETSTGNTFTAGSLDLSIDGENPYQSVKFNVSNMRPGNQPSRKYVLSNTGSLNGYLNLTNISVTSEENGCLEPEREAGDVTCDALREGELADVVNFHLYWDNDCDGYWSTGDVRIYNGPAKNIAPEYTSNKALNSGERQCVMAVFDWRNTPNDNKAQGDSMLMDLGFQLNQNPI